MNSAGAPTCPKCGGLSINPSDAQCRFCGSALAAYGAPQAYGAPPPPQGYGGPQAFVPPAPQGYGAPPGGYGAPPGGYGAPPQNYGAPQGYGAAQPGYGPQPGYGAPQGYGAPNPYGAPNAYGPQAYNPGGYPMAPVQSFGGGYGRQVNNGWSSGWSTFLWVRLAIAAAFIGLSLIGACVSAIANN